MKRKLIGVIIVALTMVAGISAFYYFRKPSTNIRTPIQTDASGGSTVTISTNNINNSSPQSSGNNSNNQIQQNNLNSNKGTNNLNGENTNISNNQNTSNVSQPSDSTNNSNQNGNNQNSSNQISQSNSKVNLNPSLAKDVVINLLLQQHLIKSSTNDKIGNILIITTKQLFNQQIAVCISSTDGEPGNAQNLANFNVSPNQVFLNLGQVFTINSSCKQIANWSYSNGKVSFSNINNISNNELIQNGYGFPS